MINQFPMDPTRWQRGLTLEEFVAGMKTHQAKMHRRLREVELPPADRSYFAQIRTPVRALVMTEDWCGDSLMNVPILARIAEAAPDMELHIYSRSQSPELNAYYTARSITHIPVFTFLDVDWNEISTWVERSQAAHSWIAKWPSAQPDIEAIHLSAGGTPEEQRARLHEGFVGSLPEMERRYVDEFQAATVAELKVLLAPIIGRVEKVAQIRA